MIVDASAIVAILKAEPEAEVFKRALALAPVCRMSPVNWFEVSVTVEKQGKADVSAFRKLADYIGLVIVPIDESQMRLAHHAWWKFGKGRHPARLNLGDCFAYALARSRNEPLLYKGSDFGRTDVESAT